jgi:hypothetical protein
MADSLTQCEAPGDWHGQVSDTRQVPGFGGKAEQHAADQSVLCRSVYVPAPDDLSKADGEERRDLPGSLSKDVNGKVGSFRR